MSAPSIDTGLRENTVLGNDGSAREIRTMRRAVFVLIVIGISIFAGSHFLLNLSKPENAAKDPPVASAPAPIDRSLSPTPAPAPASPPPRTERSGQASAPIPGSAPARPERIEEDPSDSGLEEDADTAFADRPKKRSNVPPGYIEAGMHRRPRRFAISRI